MITDRLIHELLIALSVCDIALSLYHLSVCMKHIKEIERAIAHMTDSRREFQSQAHKVCQTLDNIKSHLESFQQEQGKSIQSDLEQPQGNAFETHLSQYNA